MRKGLPNEELTPKKGWAGSIPEGVDSRIRLSVRALCCQPGQVNLAQEALMGRRGSWMPFLAVAAGYGLAFVAFQRLMPFSVMSPWFVWVAMVCFLGLAAVARPVVRIRMPRSLGRIRAWEVEGGFYRILGVPAFGRLLRRTPLRLLNRDVYLGIRGRETAELMAQLKAAEASHFWDAVLVLPYMIHVGRQGKWSTVFWFSVAQVLVNAYPIMHLRLTRYRLNRLASKKPPRPDATPRERATYRSPSTR